MVVELNSQTDRGAAIIGVAWVEEELQSAIESFLEQDKKAWDRLFGRSGALGTLSAKIDLTRLLGMCSKTIASDLHIADFYLHRFFGQKVSSGGLIHAKIETGV